MKFVIFGLTISSSWGNGHATLWRGLCRSLSSLGHEIVFFERDVPYYAENRDLHAAEFGELVLYTDWDEVRQRAREELSDADVAITTSYCSDALPATDAMLDSGAFPVFYDLDTPVTLSRLAEGGNVPYIGPRGLADYGLVLSYTGASAVALLQEKLGARRVAPLYGHVDPEVHRPVPAVESYRADLSYLGTYAEDRQAALMQLFIEPAAARPNLRFLLGGAQYPRDFPWTDNIFFVRHMPPALHPAFFSSSRLTLNVTRRSMAEMGWCPSGRLFEAAACGTPILTDCWEGLDAFFEPGREILVARTAEDAIGALDMTDSELRRIAAAARDRVLAQHTSLHRARELVSLIEAARPSSAAPLAHVMEA